MPSPASKSSPRHTLKAFWSGRRFLKLAIFSLLMGSVTYYVADTLGRSQVITNAIRHHHKIYTSFVQAVERVRANTQAEKESVAPEQASGGAVSPYWIALRDLRRQFPYYKLNIVLQTTAETEHDRKALEILKNRPRGWSLTDENEGWAMSYYVLPTRNAAAFQVVSYVHDDVSAWAWTSLVMGAYAFALLIAFGWFWTRALDEEQVVHPEFEKKLAMTQELVRTIEQALAETAAAIDRYATQAAGASANVNRELEEIAGQIRLLAVNGSIEAARSMENYRIFHVIMDEINRLAVRSRELLGNGRTESTHELAELRSNIHELSQLARTGARATGGRGESQDAIRRAG